MFHSDFLPERILVRIFRRSLADFLDTGLVASSGRVPHSDSFLIGFRYCYCNFETNAYATCAQLCCTLFFCLQLDATTHDFVKTHACPRSAWLSEALMAGSWMAPARRPAFTSLYRKMLARLQQFPNGSLPNLALPRAGHPLQSGRPSCPPAP